MNEKCNLCGLILGRLEENTCVFCVGEEETLRQDRNRKARERYAIRIKDPRYRHSLKMKRKWRERNARTVEMKRIYERERYQEQADFRENKKEIERERQRRYRADPEMRERINKRRRMARRGIEDEGEA